MSILVLGTVALDTVRTPSGRRAEMLGGSAVHFAMAARTFTKVNLVAIVGNDFPDRYIHFLRKKGITLDSLIRAQGRTFRWEGEYQRDMNCALTKKTELGVLADFMPRMTRQEKSMRYVFLANFDPDIQNYFLRELDSPRLVGLDSMNYWIQHKRMSLLKVLKKVNLYVGNDQEARGLSGENNLFKAAKMLRKCGPEMILIKKGEHGVLFYCDDFVFCLPAFPVEDVIDPTGAGDSFAGGFMGYLSKANKVNRITLHKAIAYGSVVASFNVQDFGLECTSGLNLARIDKRLRKFRENIIF